MLSQVWDEITYPFPNFNGCTMEVWEWISNFIPHTLYNGCNYLPMLGLKLIHVSKRGDLNKMSTFYWMKFHWSFWSSNRHWFWYWSLGRCTGDNPFPKSVITLHMMTSSNGNTFRVTGHLCGKFTGHRWISHTKASDVELWCLLWYAPEWTVE